MFIDNKSAYIIEFKPKVFFRLMTFLPHLFCTDFCFYLREKCKLSQPVKRSLNSHRPYDTQKKSQSVKQPKSYRTEFIAFIWALAATTAAAAAKDGIGNRSI